MSKYLNFFPSMLELLNIPSDLDFHKDFKYINKSSVRIKLREIFMISWIFSLFLSDQKLSQSKNWIRFLHHIPNFVIYRNTELIQNYFFVCFGSFCQHLLEHLMNIWQKKTWIFQILSPKKIWRFFVLIWHHPFFYIKGD
mgnify:CR=1 FL=1